MEAILNTATLVAQKHGGSTMKVDNVVTMGQQLAIYWGHPIWMMFPTDFLSFNDCYKKAK